MKKTIRILSLILALVLCAGMLSACTDTGSAGNTANGNSTGNTGSSAGSADKEDTLEYTIGEVTSIDASVLTINICKTTDKKVTDCTTVDVSTLTVTDETSSVTIAEDAEIYYTVSGELIETTPDKITEGRIIATATDNAGIQQIVILDYIGESATASSDLVVKVTDIADDGTLTLAIYELSASAAGYTITDYAAAELDNFVDAQRTQALSIDDSVIIETAQDGKLTEAAFEDIAVGDILIIYDNAEGHTAIAVYHTDDTAA